MFAKEPDLLFQSNELLNITIQAPIEKIKRKNKNSLKFDGTLSYLDVDAELINVDMKIEVRGNHRLKKSVCRFPPLKISFKKRKTKGTLFKKQKTLKLVTQCDAYRNIYTDYLMKEYLAYRILNIITPQSFYVRLVNINYQGESSSKTNFAFFIEHKKRLAKRLGARSLSIEGTSAVYLESIHLNQVSLFQLLIGNIDWSATSGGRSECCHNIKLFDKGGVDDILAIPYDFDFSGLVKAKYAVPSKDLRLDSITDRRYRGYCRNNEHLDANIELFNHKKPEILALLQDFSHLSEKQKKSASITLKSSTKSSMIQSELSE